MGPSHGIQPWDPALGSTLGSKLGNQPLDQPLETTVGPNLVTHTDAWETIKIAIFDF